MSLSYLQQESTPAHPDSIWALSWATSERIVSGCADGHVRIHNATSLAAPIHDLLTHPLAISSLSTSSNGSWALATSLDGTVVLVDAERGASVALSETGREKLNGGDVPAYSAALHPESSCWAWAGRGSKLGIRKIDAAALADPTSSEGSGASGSALAGEGSIVDLSKGKFGMDVKFSPDGAQIAVATETGHLVIVDTETQAVVTTYSAHAMSARTLSWSPDSQWIYSGSDDKRIVVHDIRAGARTGAKGEGAVAMLQGHQSWVLSVAASPDSKLIGSGGADNLVKLWDIGQRACVSTSTADAEVWSVSWQPESDGVVPGKQFAISGEDKAITLYRAAGSV